MNLIPVDTQALLRDAQAALQEAEQTNNKELRDAAESVLSALVVVLRRKDAKVPVELAPHIAVLTRRKR